MVGDNDTIVLIPSYNANLDLLLSLSSICSSEAVDVLVVDDGSDTSPDLVELKDAFKANGNIYLEVLSRNVGITVALNFGLKWISKRSYKFIARLDAGDANVGPRFKLQRDFLASNPEYALVGAWVNFIDEKGVHLFTLKHPVSHEVIEKDIYRYNTFVHPATMFTVDAINRVGKYPETYPALEDWACFIKLTKNYKSANLDVVLLNYVVANNSISTVMRTAQSRSKVRLLMDNYKFNLNQTIGLLRSILLLSFSRNFLGTIKRVFVK